MKRRIFAALLTLVMTLSLLPMNALAATDGDMSFTKTASEGPDADGNYTITMTAQAKSNKTTTTKAVPMDIVLVLDQSGSMKDEFGEGARQSAMKEAVNSFISEVASKYSDEADHRMAIVTFDDGAKTLVNWTAVDNSGETTLTSKISNLPNKPSGATNVGEGMQAAQTLMDDDDYSGSNTNRQKVVIVFTDGIPTTTDEFNTDVANSAITAAKSMKNAGATIYTVGIFNGADPSEMYGASGFDKNSDGTVGSKWEENKWGLFPSTDFPKADRPAGNRFLNLISSNYPNADSIGLTRETSGLGILHSGISYKITQNFGKTSSDYYKKASNAQDLSNIFTTISKDVIGAANPSLNGDTVITDTLSDYFTFAGTASDVKVYAIDANGDVKQSADAANAKATSSSGKTVTVTGYDFSKHYVGSDDPETLVIEIKAKPSGEGYTSANIPTNDGNATVTLDKEEINKATPPTVFGYSVEYALNEGTWTNGPAKLYYPQDANVAVTNKVPTRDGYEFTGWTSDIEGDNNVYTSDGANSSITMPAANVTLTAQWKKIETANLSVKKEVAKVGNVKVTVDATGKTIIPTAYPDDVIEWTITVTNDGNAEGTFTLKETLSGITVKNTTTNTGVKPNTDGEWGGTVAAGKSVSYTVTYTVTEDDVKAGSLVNTVTMNNTPTSAPGVPTAMKYTVTYELAGGKIGTETTYTDGSSPYAEDATVTVAPDPTKEGHTFAGWKSNIESDSGVYKSDGKNSFTMPAANVILTATWTVNKYKVTYTDGVDGEAFKDEVYQDVKYGADVPAYNNGTKPTRKNYTFAGWTPAVPATMPANDLKFTATWEKNPAGDGTFDFNNVDGTHKPAITKTVKGNVGKNFKETFEVLVKPESKNAAGTMTAAFYTGKAEVTYADLTSAFEFARTDKLTFSAADTYRYTVREVKGETGRMSYDTTEYTLTIEVALNESTNKYEVKSCQFSAGGKTYDGQLNIVNTYRAYHPSTPSSKPTLNTGDHYAYVMGYPDGTVRPNGSITRAEVSTILFRLLSDKTREEYFTTESSFTDVKAGSWYNNSVATLEKAGVIVDTAKGGAFRPNEAITRAELAAMLAQFADAKPVKGVKFSDVSADHWAYDAIAIAAKMGWIEGYPDGTFRPDATITRAEMMTLVNRALERVPSDEDHLLSKRVMLTFPDCKSSDWFYIAVQEATNSHAYERAATEKNGDEQWTALRDNRDWTKLEY